MGWIKSLPLALYLFYIFRVSSLDYNPIQASKVFSSGLVVWLEVSIDSLDPVKANFWRVLTQVTCLLTVGLMGLRGAEAAHISKLATTF